MEKTQLFPGVISTLNGEGNTRTPISQNIMGGSAEGVPAPAPDPTPATSKNGGGVGRWSRCEGGKLSERKIGVRVFLTERDREILKLCFEQQFLLREHVGTFFRGCSARRTNYRIQCLVEGGYLKREVFPELMSQTVLRLSKRGREEAQAAGVRTEGYLPRLNAKTLFHDALITSCRIRIGEVWQCEFYPERALKEWQFTEVPDGVFKFPKGDLVALEVECSDKGRKRFLRRLHELGKVEALKFVLYVAGSPRMFSIVRSYLFESASEQPAGVILWEQLKDGVPTITTARGDLDLFAKREW